MAADLDRAYVINGDDLRIALARTRITIEEPEISSAVPQPLWAKGAPQDPAGLAAELLSRCGAYPDAGIREPHATGPRLHDADLCARCGNQFKPGQVCDSCRVATTDPWAGDDEPDTNAIGIDHVCEHLIGDREVQLMVDILRGMAGLDNDARQRIRNWVDERFVPRRSDPF